MNKLAKPAALAALAAALLLPAGARAGLVHALDGRVVTVPALDYSGAGPQALGSNITWSSDWAGARFGHTGEYGLAGNGHWSAGGAYIALDAGGGATMAFDFATPVSGFGGFFNHATRAGAAVIATYDAGGALLERFTLALSTPGQIDAGAFYGFASDRADISRFTMSGAWIVGKDFVVQDAPVPMPAPSSAWLLGLGLMVLARPGFRRAGRSSR